MNEASEILQPPEFMSSSKLLDEIRALINQPRYDHLSMSELCGVFDMLKFEYLYKWHNS